MFKTSIFLILFFSFFYSFSQSNDKIDYIRFSYNVSSVVFTDVDIIIIENPSKGKLKYNMKVEYYEGMTKMTKTKTLDEKDFNKLVEAINKIKISDLVQNFATGLDGSQTEIEFGNMFFNTIKINLWTIHKSQKETSLKSFIEFVELILDFAKINIEDYN